MKEGRPDRLAQVAMNNRKWMFKEDPWTKLRKARGRSPLPSVFSPTDRSLLHLFLFLADLKLILAKPEKAFSAGAIFTGFRLP